MNKITVRLAGESDVDTFLDFQTQTANNLFDPESGLYPSSFTLCADNEQPIVYVPIQPMLIMESLGINPQANKREVAVALAKLTRDICARAKKFGMGEIGFSCADKSTEEFAERHGFEKMPTFYRLKVKNCE